MLLLLAACSGADDPALQTTSEDAFTGSSGLPALTVSSHEPPEKEAERVTAWAEGERAPAETRIIAARSESDGALLPAGIRSASAGALNEVNDQLGRAVATGDFDGDGYADVAIGAPFEDFGTTMSAGAVFVFHGGAGGLTHETTLTQGTLSNSETSDRFGFSLAADDLDGDGRDDLVIGAPFEREGNGRHAGAVFIYRGSNAGLVEWRVLTQENLGMGVNEEGDRFGWAVAVGDFDGDSWGEIAIGAPGEAPSNDPKAGAVFVVEANLAGVTAVKVLQQTAAHGPLDHERFGASLIAGRFIGSDFRDDLVVGAFNERDGGDFTGAIYFYRGDAAQNLFNTARWLQQGLKEHDDHFGRAFAAGDFNGDGGLDLAVSHSGENDGEGAVSIYHFTVFGPTHVATLDYAPFGDVNHGDYFGTSMTAGDVDGDGIDDLIVGAPNAGILSGIAREGRLGVFRGTIAGLTPLGVLSQTFLGGNDAGDRLGFSLAAGDIDGDGYDDVVAGAPGETMEGRARAGAAYVYRGSEGSPFVWIQVVQSPE